MTVSPEGSGNTTLNGNFSPEYPCNYSLESGTDVRVEAIPSPGYEFVRWEGDLTGSENPVSLTMDAGKSVIAHFARVMHTLSLETTEGGTVSPSAGDYTYEEGARVSITAVPDDGWQFAGWKGSLPGAVGDTVSLTMDEDYRLEAVFFRVYHTLTILTEGNGTVTPAPGTYTVAGGETVKLSATPDDGWQFSGWSGVSSDDGDNGVTIDSDTVITALFTKKPVNWGLIGGIAGGILVIGAGLLWVLKLR